MGSTDTHTVSSLARRLARIERQLDPEQIAEIAKAMGGTSIGQLVKALFHAIDGETIEQKARELTGTPPDADPGEARERSCA